MRVAAKAVDDGFVPELELMAVCGGARLEERVSKRVDARRFAVHIGHVQKGAFALAQGEVSAGSHRGLGQGQGQWVSFEGAGVATVDVSGKLIEHDDFSQPAMRIGPPLIQLGLERLLMQGPKALGNQAVKSRVNLPPLGGGDLMKPELQDGLVHFSGRLFPVCMMAVIGPPRRPATLVQR